MTGTTPAKTYFEKVWNDHVITDFGDGSALLQIDRLILHELSGSWALNMLEASGRDPACPKQIYSVVDHLISTRPGRGPEDTGGRGGAETIRKYRSLAARYGLSLFDVGDHRQGIVHVVSPELAIALPGLTLVCGDSHTCTVGGVGTLGWGIGATEAVHVAATQALVQTRPKTMRINFEGQLGRGVYAKDVILHLIGKIGANGGIGYAVEFAGPAIRSLPIEGRLTLCNMAIEFSAKYGFVGPDDTTFDYLHGRDFAPKGEMWDRAVAYWRALSSEADAVFDRELTIDATEIGPQVTWGTSPQHVVAVGGRVPDPASAPTENERATMQKALDYIQLEPGVPIEGVKIDAAYIGACTNARISDLREAAAILRGKKIAPGLKALCVPGSTQVKLQAEAEGLDKIFIEAGFDWHESGCAMCSSGGGPIFTGLRVISTTNRNFEGRQGLRTRTHLASPATVAASAIAGAVTDTRNVPQ